jgi:hypothetical protein
MRREWWEMTAAHQKTEENFPLFSFFTVDMKVLYFQCSIFCLKGLSHEIETGRGWLDKPGEGQ